MTDPSIADPPSLYSPALIAKPAPPVAGPAAARTKLLRCGDWAATSAKTRISKAQDAMLTHDSTANNFDRSEPEAFLARLFSCVVTVLLWGVTNDYQN